MPGQEALAGDGLAPEAREMFATLVAHWFREHADPDEHFTVTAVNPNRSTSSRQVWPTPLAAFLRDSPWFPVDWPAGGADGRRHLPCRQVWLAADNQSERPPAVLPQIAISFRRALARLSPERLDLLVRMCGLRVLNRVEDLWAQADFLASFYATGAVARHDARAFARLYEQTWALLADAASGPAEAPLRHLLVRQGGELRAVDLAAERSGTDRQPVYVRDGADELPADLLAAAGRAVFDVGAAKASRVAALVQSLADDVFVPASSALIAAFADGVEIKAALAGGALPPCCAPIVARCPSLPVLVLLAMEALNGAAARRLPADRREVVDRLADVVVWPANALTFRVGGEPVDVPPGATAAVLVAAPGRQVVVGSGVRDSILAWADLTRMLPKVSEAVAQPDLAVHLRALFGELEKRNLPVDGTVADDVLAALAGVLWLKPDAALAALDLLNARAERWLPWLEAVVHCCAGEAARAAFAASAPGLALDAAALKAAVERHVADSGIAADRLIDACRRSRAPGQLRDDLGLDFAAFNRSLRAAGLAPETHPALHKAAWATFIDTHWADILLPLRGHCAAKLDQRRPAPEYPELLSELRRLEPDEDWLERHQAPPEPLCRARVEAWLKARSLPAIGKSPIVLPPYLETRKGNTEAVRRFAGKAGERVRAWCAGQRTSAPPLWQDPGSSPQALFAALEAVGVIDFRPLEEATLVGWAVALALWPDGMPPALDLAALGLKTEALEKQRQSDKDSRDQRNKELRSFVFNGRSVDPREADREALSAEIAMGMPRSLRSAGLANPLKLAPLPPTTRSGGGTSRGTGGGAGRTNREKTEIVGYMGEAAVYHWLKAKFANQDIDAAWVSSNREALLLEPGNDGLGYDFEVRFRRQTWRLEVKASLGDPCQFEMGETEVRAARDALLSRTAERYCIVYVSNLATPSELRIEVLPNPLSEEAAGLLRVRGEGLRYQFKRA
nr:hypothetical protein ABAZ39_14450 [Azospirillum argentinense]